MSLEKMMKEEPRLSKQHNYSQYSNKKNDGKHEHDKYNPEKPKNTVPAEALNPIAPTPEAPVVKTVKETVKTETIPETVEGVVVNCAKLNVRAEPSTEADIIYTLDVMSEIEIDVAKSDKEWFKICTATGVEGYCMRKFIEAQL